MTNISESLERKEMRRALACLRLEVPEVVADHVANQVFTYTNLIEAALTTKNQEIERLKEVIEAADSLIASYQEGDLDGWEIALYRNRRNALEDFPCSS